MFKSVEIPVELIDVVEEVPVLSPNPGQVTFLAEQIESGEELQPIFVFPKGDRYILVDGINRLEAHRLKGLTTIKATLVDLADVTLDEVIFLPEIYPRHKVNQDRVEFFAELMRCGQKFPLIFTAKSEDGFVLLDGKHRLEAFRKAGIHKIKICVLDIANHHWDFAYARFNAYGSMPYSTAEIERAITETVKQGVSMERVARRLGLPLEYVSSVVG